MVKISKPNLFLELAQPDADGVSRWVFVSEFTGKYADLELGNGFSWGRKNSALAKRYKIEVRRDKTPGNQIDGIRLNGYNDEGHFSQTIRRDIAEAIRRKKCVMLGVHGNTENTTVEADHKNGRKNDPRVSDPATQRIDDFQPLCKAANDIKRQICKICKRNNKRWDAKNIEGNPYSFYEGTEEYTEELGCVGCYQYDPVEYRKRCALKISQETIDYILTKIYPGYQNPEEKRMTAETTYTIADIAGILQMTQKAVRRLVASGELKSSRQNNKYIISDSDFKDFKRRSPLSNEALAPAPDAPAGKTTVSGSQVAWADIAKYWAKPRKSQMTFVDLFCGAGGLSKGLEMSGLEGICGLDFFKEACMTYERNFRHPFVNGDIKKNEIKQKFYNVVRERLNGRHLDIVAGGFPCQGFSMAGNRIVNDPRNSLYLELIEVVKELQPDFVICENVKGLRSMLKGKVEQKILSDFREIGYDMTVAVLCAADYYTPQKRERVIFIGNRIGVKNYHPKPLLTPERYVTTGQAIADLMSHPEDAPFNHVPTKHRPDMAKRMLELAEGQSLYKGYSDAWKKCPWNEASCTIKENHGGVNIHPKLPRVLTAREMARIQSFPDDFIFLGAKNKQLVQIGNAVPPLLGKAVGLAIRLAAGDLE